jgi:Ca-activated chloride channel homolog
VSTIFDYPFFLLLVPAALPPLLLVCFRISRLLRALPLLCSVDPRVYARSLYARTICYTAAWIMLALAAAGPRIGTRIITVREEGSAVVFVLDISRSMAVRDLPPDRLSFAARYSAMLADRLVGVPCALVLAKGSAVLALPLTADRTAFLDILGSLSPAMLTSPGSGLASGLRTAIAAFPENSTASKFIVLLSDGDETSGSLDDAASDVRFAGVNLVSIGIGTEAGSEIDAFPFREGADMKLTRLRVDLLKNAAVIAGGSSVYIDGTEVGSALRIAEIISSPSGRELAITHSSEPVSRHAEFLFAALVFFAVGLAAGGAVWKNEKV